MRIEFNPTVPHCSLATLIGLCIRVKVQRNLPHNIKLDIFIKKGAHNTEHESEYHKKYLGYQKILSFSVSFKWNHIFLVVNKQINDKERIAAAMENPSLSELVEKCIKDDE